MIKKILIFTIVCLVIGLNLTQCVNATIKIRLFSSTNANQEHQVYIQEISENIDSKICSSSSMLDGNAFTRNQATFGYDHYTTEWDSNRQMWRYTYRFDWYALCPEPYNYYQLDVTTRTIATGVVPDSSNEFGYGGWNIKESSEGDYSTIAEKVCSYVIGLIPGGSYFQTGAELAAFLKDHFDPDHPDEAAETHKWVGGKAWGECRWIKEASGFYQYDVYVYPSTDFEINWNIDVGYNCRAQDHEMIVNEYTMTWSLETTSPDYLYFDQPSIDFGKVKVGECSSEKSLRLTNPAQNPVTVYGFTLYDTAFKITEGDADQFTLSGNGGSRTIKIQFCPRADTDYETTIKPQLYQEIEPTCTLKGTGDDGCCFLAGTKITMADGTYKNIEDIRPGECVKSYNVKTGTFTKWRVKLLGSPVHPVYEINNGLLSFTEDHPIFIKKPDGKTGWGAANVDAAKSFTRLKKDILAIEANDQLYTSDGEWIKITSIEFKSEPVQTYNIMSFSGIKTYFANDILVFEENPPFSVWKANNFYIQAYLEALIEAILNI